MSGPGPEYDPEDPWAGEYDSENPWAADEEAARFPHFKPFKPRMNWTPWEELEVNVKVEERHCIHVTTDEGLATGNFIPVNLRVTNKYFEIWWESSQYGKWCQVAPRSILKYPQSSLPQSLIVMCVFQLYKDRTSSSGLL